MTSTGQNATMYAGDNKILEFTVVDGDGAAKDLTGATAANWSLSKRPDTTALVEKTLGVGVEITTPSTGTVQVTLAAANTASLNGTYYHELEITDASAKVATCSIGYITVKDTLI